jgi:ABC-type phosphate transport system substrate-binding protein
VEKLRRSAPARKAKRKGSMFRKMITLALCMTLATLAFPATGTQQPVEEETSLAPSSGTQQPAEEEPSTEPAPSPQQPAEEEPSTESATEQESETPKAQPKTPPKRRTAVAIVVNKENPVSDISLAELKDIFLGVQQSWNGGDRIVAVGREEGSEEKEIVLDKIYNMSGTQLKQYWTARVIRGNNVNPPKTFPSDTLIKQLVQRVPNAVGYIRADQADDSVKVLKVEGKEPGQAGYPVAR